MDEQEIIRLLSKHLENMDRLASDIKEWRDSTNAQLDVLESRINNEPQSGPVEQIEE